MEQYQSLFIDFDGTICDTNSLKEANIYSAASEFVSAETAKEFQLYFTKNNGIPREEKTQQFFKNQALEENILAQYAKLNENLNEAPLMPGILDFLTRYQDKNLIILSGGKREEIEAYLKNKRIIFYFQDILCGPVSKEKHLSTVLNKTPTPAVILGDSYYDYQVATLFHLDFVFLHQGTQLKDWQNIAFKNTKITLNFKTLMDELNEKNSNWN